MRNWLCACERPLQNRSYTFELTAMDSNRNFFGTNATTLLLQHALKFLRKTIIHHSQNYYYFFFFLEIGDHVYEKPDSEQKKAHTNFKIYLIPQVFYFFIINQKKQEKGKKKVFTIH